MRYHDSIPAEHIADRVSTKEVLGICRNHIESLQNLRYITSIDADHPTQVRLNLRMMEWHLNNLSEALFSNVDVPEEGGEDRRDLS
jgi:hypothetical protein